MSKKIVVIHKMEYNLATKKEETTDICNNMDESQKHTMWKKLDTKEWVHIVCFYSYAVLE